MRLYVNVLAARGLSPPPPKASRRRGGADDAGGVYVKLKAGKHKTRTRSIPSSSLDPIVWNEEFVFRLEDDGSSAEAEEEELKVDVFRELDDGAVGGRRRELLGRVFIPVDEDGQSIPATWFQLQPRRRLRSMKTKPKKAKDCGYILLSLSSNARFYGDYGTQDSSNYNEQCDRDQSVSHICSPTGEKPSSMTSADLLEPAVVDQNDITTISHDPPNIYLDKNEEQVSKVSGHSSHLGVSGASDSRNKETNIVDGTFDDAMKCLQTLNENEMPDNLPGGILLECSYLIDPKDLNFLLFGPNSQLRKDLSQKQGSLDYQEEPWTWNCMDKPCLTRLVEYTKPESKLVKAVKATEEQIYVKGDGKNYAVLVRVDTPDVPYGDSFQVVLLYKIIPGPELSAGEKSSLLVISWNIDFHQSTIMKSIIQGTAEQGLKESYAILAEMVSQHCKAVDVSELLEKDRLLASMKLDHPSNWKLAIQYFSNLTVVSTILMVMYVVFHILRSGPAEHRGLEFTGLDLPDTLGELISTGILYLHVEQVRKMIVHFIQARIRRGADHAVKSHGDGWLLTVALVEGNNLPSATLSGLPDPYVVFSCNGKTRTSSVLLQSADPHWNEILEFDAMQEPPSVLDIEVFDFDGPFSLEIPLGHAKINFLRHTTAELADIWVPLEGKLPRRFNSKLHLRIFVDNTKGSETIKGYMENMEKEVGKKLNLPSVDKNSTFQKIFSLPKEEFLVDDFSCCLMRKIPLQGRLFVSARILGFYSNFIGHKTKFFFLWEDIEDIQVKSPSLATIGSPAILIILKSCRGLDAKHGAKSLDEKGRLKFQFQAFASFTKSSRTIMALRSKKTLAIEEDAKSVNEEHSAQSVDTESVLSNDNANLSKAYSLELPLDVNAIMEAFSGSQYEYNIMRKVGCVNYTATGWEAVATNVYERRVSYKFNSRMSIFGAQVTSNQRKAPLVDGRGWIVDEVMSIHNVPFGDHFRIHVSHRFEILQANSSTSQCDVFIGIEWMKSTKLIKKRITKNICEKLAERSKEVLHFVKESSLSRDD